MERGRGTAVAANIVVRVHVVAARTTKCAKQEKAKCSQL